MTSNEYISSVPSTYAALARKIYSTANALPSRGLRRDILTRLFTSLQDDALLFFASIFASSCSHELQESALYHACAFVDASTSAASGIDFQTILPAILVSLTHASQPVREAAGELLAKLKKGAEERKFGSVYKFDGVYPGANELQYLSQDGLKAYLGVLHTHVEHCVVDPRYLGTLHKEVVVDMGGSGKKKGAR